MMRSHALPRRLIVEARDLDTDARARQEVDVDAPADEAGQRAQLADVVARLHPEARMRSFGNGAASFQTRRSNGAALRGSAKLRATGARARAQGQLHRCLV
jgi:hypothetical protein